MSWFTYDLSQIYNWMFEFFNNVLSELGGKAAYRMYVIFLLPFIFLLVSHLLITVIRWIVRNA